MRKLTAHGGIGLKWVKVLLLLTKGETERYKKKNVKGGQNM